MAITASSNVAIETQLPSDYSRAFMLTVSVPLVTLTVVGNLMVILAWLRDPRVRSPSNAYLVSLAFVDLLIGAVNMPLGVMYNYEGHWTLGVTACQFWLGSLSATFFIGSAHLVLIALDRHQIVFEGVSYVVNRPYNGLVQCIVGVWLVGLWNVLPIVLDWQNVSVDPGVKAQCLIKYTVRGTFYFTSLNIIFPGVLMSWLYARIYLQMRTRWRARVGEKQSIKDYSSTGSAQLPNIGRTAAEDREMDRKANDKKEQKAFVTLGILIAIFIVCWFPYIVTTLVRAYGRQVPRILTLLSGVLGWTNSAVNPIIYAVRIPKFQEAFKLLWRWN